MLEATRDRSRLPAAGRVPGVEVAGQATDVVVEGIVDPRDVLADVNPTLSQVRQKRFERGDPLIDLMAPSSITMSIGA